MRLFIAIFLLVAAWLAINRPPEHRTTLVRATPAPGPSATPSAVAAPAHEAALELLPIIREDVPDESSAHHLLLHIPIKTLAKSSINVRDLVVQVLFYDIVDGQSVVQTAAAVNSRWTTPPADWVNSDTEELDVDYQLPKSTTTGATKAASRKYYGYIVRIYYQQQLQAAASQPERLAQQYPPPATLAQEPSPETSTHPSVQPLTETAGTPVPVDGIAAGATLGLLPITSEEKPDENSAKR
ncbi:MAG TPA: hypothetical protein VGL72_22910, partial [Bryobacteraceae bacterium]